MIPPLTPLPKGIRQGHRCVQVDLSDVGCGSGFPAHFVGLAQVADDHPPAVALVPAEAYPSERDGHHDQAGSRAPWAVGWLEQGAAD